MMELKKERVTEEEVAAAVRGKGQSLESVEAVILETDGSFSVLGRTHRGDGVLRNVDLPAQISSE